MGCVMLCKISRKFVKSTKGLFKDDLKFDMIRSGNKEELRLTLIPTRLGL